MDTGKVVLVQASDILPLMQRLAALLLLSTAAFARDDAPAPAAGAAATPPQPGRDQARSMIVTRYGIVATSQFLASQAGAKVLDAGGNAIDAAIAANSVVGLTQPYVNGIGGDLIGIHIVAQTGNGQQLN